MPREVRGAEAVVAGALMFSHLARFARPALVNGAAGIVTVRDGHPESVMALTIADGRIVAIDIVADPERLRHLDVAVLDD